MGPVPGLRCMSLGFISGCFGCAAASVSLLGGSVGCACAAALPERKGSADAPLGFAGNDVLICACTALGRAGMDARPVVRLCPYGR